VFWSIFHLLNWVANGIIHSLFHLLNGFIGLTGSTQENRSRDHITWVSAE
jgi:hypothetical protein